MVGLSDYYRLPSVLTKTKNYPFQTLEWALYDEKDPNDDLEKLVIRAFGVDETGNSVCCSIKGFEPSLYVKIPDTWEKKDVIRYLEILKTIQKNGKKMLNYYTIRGYKSHLIELHKDFLGFTNNKQFKFCKLIFYNERAMKAYKYTILYQNVMKLYETNIDPLLKFYHNRNIQPSNWVNVKKFVVYKDNDAPSTCQINIECEYNEIFPEIRDYNANILQASYDIETYSAPKINDDGKEFYPFPVPEKDLNVVYQIATCFKKFNDPDFFVKTILTLKKCSPIDQKDTFVIECKDEADLLTKWKGIIESMDPDILYQYNGDMFDCQYMVKRCIKLGVQSKFMQVSRMLDYPAILKEETFSSSAYGNNSYQRLKIPGRINFDVLIYIKREFKENSYKLDNVSEKYLGEKKNDIKVVDIFKAYETGDPDQIRKIGLYCIQDTLLPQKLVDTLHILQSQISMSNVTFVPIRFLIERGQQIKALSQIAKNTIEKGYLIPHFEYQSSEGTESFEGATVLSPSVGVYDIPITTLDFASLYPSIMRAHNLCYTTIVLENEFQNIPGVEYLKVDIDTRSFWYAQNVDSILPDLLADLAVQRKKFKKLMNTTDDPKIQEIYNKTQLAYKVSMNSVYGILGSSTIGCKPIAASVTKIGRDMIKDTKHFIEHNHHNVYPVGYNTAKLEPTDVVQIRAEGKEQSITVQKAEKLMETTEVFIKTIKGWRRCLR